MSGVELIAAERRRQVEEKGWTAEHDRAHDHGELAVAAAELAVDGTDAEVKAWGFAGDLCGAVAKHGYLGTAPNRIQALVIAGALIAAEIDRVNASATPQED